LEEKPLRGLRWNGGATLSEMDRIEWDVPIVEIENYRLKAGSSGTVSGLLEMLADADSTGMRRVLDHLEIGAQIDATEELDGLNGFVEGFNAGGTASVSTTISSWPGNRLEVSTLTDFQNAAF